MPCSMIREEPAISFNLKVTITGNYASGGITKRGSSELRLNVIALDGIDKECALWN